MSTLKIGVGWHWHRQCSPAIRKTRAALAKPVAPEFQILTRHKHHAISKHDSRPFGKENRVQVTWDSILGQTTAAADEGLTGVGDHHYVAASTR